MWTRSTKSDFFAALSTLEKVKMPILSALGVTEYENKRKTQQKHNIQQMTFYLKNDLHILLQESLCSLAVQDSSIGDIVSQ